MHVLLVDDHELLWNGTRRLLEEVVCHADPPAELDFRAVRSLQAALQLAGQPMDLVLLDYHLPAVGGVEALQAVKSAFDRAVVCMLSAETDAAAVREVLEAGAAGFIPKGYSASEMADALRLVLRHRVYVPSEFVLTEEVVRGPDGDGVRNEDLAVFLRGELSPRQRQVLKLALQGLPNKSIARTLGIAEGTVKVHLSMVYRALGVRNRVGALCRVLKADAVSALQ